MLDPKIYNRLFEQDRDGQAVIEELSALFYHRPSYKKGDDAMSAAYGEGQRSVIAFIMHKRDMRSEE